MTGGLGIPIVSHATRRTLKMHEVGVDDRVNPEQVTIVLFVIVGHVPQVELTMKLSPVRRSLPIVQVKVSNSG